MARWFLALSACTVLGLGASGCGDDDGATRFDSGVNGDTQLGDLTPEERVTICQNQAAFVRATVDTSTLARFVCAFQPAVLLAETDEACATALDTCVNAFAVKVDVTVTDSSQAQLVCQTFPVSQCEGTVADYENCVDSIADVQIELGTSFSCGRRSEYEGGPLVGVNACRAVGPACTAASDPVIR